MENSGVHCCVCECVHNVGMCKCNLAKIDITNEKTMDNSIAVPHFCKSYQQK